MPRRGSKTSLLEPLSPVVKALERYRLGELSYGYIRSVKGRRDARVDVKIREISGAILLSCTTKHYHQELRLYTKEERRTIAKILQQELPRERYRIRYE